MSVTLNKLFLSPPPPLPPPVFFFANVTHHDIKQTVLIFGAKCPQKVYFRSKIGQMFITK